MSWNVRGSVELKPEFKNDLLSLKESLGWKLLRSVVEENRDILMHAFLRCQTMDEVAITKGKVAMIDYILAIPDELIDALPEKEMDASHDPFTSESLES